MGSRPSNASAREIVRCLSCGLVQYRTRNGVCRRCLHMLPKVEFVIPLPVPRNDMEETPFCKCRNRAMVENVGERIR